MSFSVFKSSMLAYMSNQNGITSYTQFANKITTEYDMCVRRGFQLTNNIPLSSSNKAGMLALVNIACQKASFVQSGSHNFIDDIGKGVLAYWSGATLMVGIPPIIPADGSISNITTTNAIVTNPGKWTSFGPEFPTNNTNDFLDILISAMKIHLTTIGGMYLTVSMYPGFPLVPPAPGVRTWEGWEIPD